MKVIFAHGKEGSPNGRKATFIRNTFNAITPDLHKKPLEEQVDILKQLVRENPDCLLVGSSMGGAAASIAAWEETPSKLLLLAPALSYPECKGVPEDLDTVILHGTNDEIIPHDVSVEAQKKSGCELILVEDCHRLLLSKQKITELITKMIDD